MKFQPAVLVGPVCWEPQDKRKPRGQSRGWSMLVTVSTPLLNSTLPADRGRAVPAAALVGSVAEMLCTHGAVSVKIRLSSCLA